MLRLRHRLNGLWKQPLEKRSQPIENPGAHDTLNTYSVLPVRLRRAVVSHAYSINASASPGQHPFRS